MRVLVVDDEPIVLKSCRLVLEAEGWEVVSASSVAEALSFLEGGNPQRAGAGGDGLHVGL